MDKRTRSKLVNCLNQYIEEDVNQLSMYLVGSLAESYHKATSGSPPYDADIVIIDNFTMKKKEYKKFFEENSKLLLQNYETGLEIKGTEFAIHIMDKDNLNRNEKFVKLN